MTATVGEFSAPASALGYLYQCRYALLLALQVMDENPGWSISVERFDDISVDDDGHPLVYLQSKVHVSTPGNLTDRSSDLWKTIRVWASALSNNNLPTEGVRFLLITTGTAPAGSIASLLGPGEGRDAQRALGAMEQICREESNCANKPGYDAFYALSADQRWTLLESITVIDGSPSITDVRSQILQYLNPAAPREKVDEFVNRLEGWWGRRLIEAMVAGGESITLIELESKIDELRESFKREALPMDFADYVPSQSLTAGHTGRAFVRQLEAIEVRGERVVFAIRDFMRAFEQRTYWVEKLFIFDEEIARYESRLIEVWVSRFAEATEELGVTSAGGDKIKAGRGLYKWVEQEAQVPIRSEPSRFLCVGSYHMLSDQMRVGWHPDYLSIVERTVDGSK